MNSSVALPRSDAKFDSLERALGIKVSDLNLGWGTALTAHLEVGERISELGVYRAGDGLHAEEHLLEELEAYWDEYAEKEVENIIVIKITRSPCGKNSHNCSGQLAAFISDKKPCPESAKERRMVCSLGFKCDDFTWWNEQEIWSPTQSGLLCGVKRISRC